MIGAAVEVLFAPADTSDARSGVLDYSAAVGRRPGPGWEVALLHTFCTSDWEGRPTSIRDLTMSSGSLFLSGLATAGSTVVPLDTPIPDGWDGRITVAFRQGSPQESIVIVPRTITVWVAIRRTAA